MTKLVSLRMNEKALKALDETMKSLPYWKKHAVMVHLLESMLLNADTKTIATIMRHNPYSSMKLTITASEESLVK